ncbi:PEGA domain-containing protein [Marinibactrum halimedae]|uniref:PEGA domain-containing protein n=1 Tax=Marinibactrum halimedae TaxID=1444977 RepID=A0AA37TEU1_9GAMM|nr:PEGA domain-containing protein [Marinibactrum halimedae]MCD9458045.1 PEGA domain-containing protein [Marinibactrum halimedae]GLS27672.1 hypothetical protein GCM10007877_33910 [Marinibactrum halimedae]
MKHRSETVIHSEPKENSNPEAPHPDSTSTGEAGVQEVGIQKLSPSAFTPKKLSATPFAPAQPVATKSSSAMTPTNIAIALALILCLAIGWYLFAARSLIVYPTPADAEIRITDGYHLQLADNYLLLPGEYTLNAEHPDHYPYSEPLVITKNPNQTIDIAMQPLPGHVWVKTTPDALVQIFIDGSAAGDNRTRIDDIPAGTHEYTLTSERFQTAKGTLEVTGKRQEQTLNVMLTPAWANIRVNSIPEGADIVLNEQTLGTTPSNVEMLEGEHVLQLRKSGYKTAQYPLVVTAEQDQTLRAIVLEKIDGLVTLNSTPSGASVTIDGQYVGQTPLEAPIAPGNDLKVRFFKDGYKPAYKTFSVASGGSASVSAKLNVLIGSVRINATPKDALLYVDDRLMGRADQRLELPARQHRIRVTAEGHVDYLTQVLPRPGLEQQLNPKLKTTEEAKWENIKPTITTVTGQTLKLFRPNDRFDMGASRREQGRRANEVMRAIQLTRPFYLATHETTNEQFRRFLRGHSSGHVKGNSLNNDRHPAVNLTWLQAARFCNWLSEQEKLPPFYEFNGDELAGFNLQSHGYRLPTEAEWAWAARFEKGTMLKYPWGKNLPPPPKSGNFADRSGAPILGVIQSSYDDGFVVTAPVGSFKSNHHGLFDMAGNAAEWVNDFYMVKTGLSLAAEEDPVGPAKGDYHVIRGSSWSSGSITDLRLSYRDYGSEPKPAVGFRIARYVE